MRKFRLLLLSFAVVAACGCLSLAAYSASPIVNHIERDSGGNVKIHQPESLDNRLTPERGAAPKSNVEEDKPDNSESTEAPVHHRKVIRHVAGYRVQVFADNNPRTAKREALVRERIIISRFPLLQAYLSFDAPVWRLRLGDFSSIAEAQDNMHQLKRAFPSYASEMRVVRDRINLSVQL
jgi:hypothetical protein